MPGWPTIFEHRDPRDEIRRPMTALAADPQSVLNALTVMAAEQQTMNFYMTIGNRPQEPLARGLYAEIAEIEEQHVSHYESILDPPATRSEERRVGKECVRTGRSRGTPEHYKKQHTKK